MRQVDLGVASEISVDDDIEAFEAAYSITNHRISVNNVDDAEMLVIYEVEREPNRRLWDLSEYATDDQERFLEKLLSTFNGIGSHDDAKRQQRLEKIVSKVKRNIEAEDGIIDANQWAAKLHGTYLMSEVLSRILPATDQRERRFMLLVETRMNNSDRTPLEELLSVNVEDVDELHSTEKIALFTAFLAEVNDIVDDKASYFEDLMGKYE